jgi:phosphoribosylformylglycinamidine synthase
VQKGNAPEERKLQRLFRNAEASSLIKRCNDFGAGGVCVAIGELADGLTIDLDKVPVKYEGLDGTELAISESQERMAVVCAPEDAARLIALADAENLSAVPVAEVTREPKLVMRWRGETIVDLPRSFIDSNGAQKHAAACVETPRTMVSNCPNGGFHACYRALVSSLNHCSKKGLSERFDSTVGAYSVLMPFGGARQLTPPQAMAAKLPLLSGETDACTTMAWGYDPVRSESSPYSGGYAAVVDSLSKLAATGAPLDERYLTFQEYFGKPGLNPARWGKPVAALLGALEAQLGLGVCAIGGKDSMSGSFEHLDVPPTLVSFAVGIGTTQTVLSPEFKRAGSSVALLLPEYRADGLPELNSLKRLFSQVHALIASKQALAIYAVGSGGIADAVFQMSLGNGIGFRYADGWEQGELFWPRCGAFVVELANGCNTGLILGSTTAERELSWRMERIPLNALEAAYENTLEDVFPTRVETLAQDWTIPPVYATKWNKPCSGAIAKPRVLIPVFPGTNCEYESARVVERAGAAADVLVLRTSSPEATKESLLEFARRLDAAQALLLPGGFSNGDEPDGSGKYITAFLRSQRAADALNRLLHQRDGLALGICNGFQALIKLGLLPTGSLAEPAPNSPTLTFNRIGRHQSGIVRTRIISNRSPWLMLAETGGVYHVPVSHGEGRFLCPSVLLNELAANGQIAAQYVDESCNPTMDVRSNPNGSDAAVEAITSPDGRVLGKMGHSERIGTGLYQNVPGRFDLRLFESLVRYYS